mmetsp:Transcript_27818/g.54549  ORF Transcript_27818/g.54549 Transcript_27818/m.54549 type:complete len:206 (-) Transcript_27818:1266-1883(-)
MSQQRVDWQRSAGQRGFPRQNSIHKGDVAIRSSNRQDALHVLPPRTGEAHAVNSLPVLAGTMNHKVLQERTRPDVETPQMTIMRCGCECESLPVQESGRDGIVVSTEVPDLPASPEVPQPRHSVCVTGEDQRECVVRSHRGHSIRGKPHPCESLWKRCRCHRPIARSVCPSARLHSSKRRRSTRSVECPDRFGQLHVNYVGVARP